MISPVRYSCSLDIGEYKVKEVPFEKWDKIQSLAQEWAKLAETKYRKILINCSDSESTHLDPKNIFTTSMNICLCIKDQLFSSGRFLSLLYWNSVLVCKDSSKKIQAIGLWNKEHYKLCYLATHPDNLRHEINENGKRGTGSSIILYLAQEALQSNSTIRLTSASNSIKFYRKLGFIEDSANQTKADYFVGALAMQLTAEAIKKLVSEQKKPFYHLSNLPNQFDPVIEPDKEFSNPIVAQTEHNSQD